MPSKRAAQPGWNAGRSRKRVMVPKKVRVRSVRSKRMPFVCKRMTYSSTWAFGTAATNDFFRYYTWTAADITNFAEFASVFDEYKISAVKVTFRPAYDSVSNLTAAGALVQPQAYAHYVIDPAATTVPAGLYTSANLNSFLENEGIRTKTLNKEFSIYLKPKVLMQNFGGGTASTVVDSDWIKTSETAVQHRGFYIFLQQNAFAATNTNIKLDTFYTFYLQFRNVK